MGIICSLCGKTANEDEFVPLRPGTSSEHKIVFNRIKTDSDTHKRKDNNEGQYLDKTMKEIMETLSSDGDDDILETKEYEEILKQLDDSIQNSIKTNH